MSTYQTERVARQQASARTNKTGIEHFAVESANGWLVGTMDEINESFGRVEDDCLTASFRFAGEDTKYVKVSVAGKVFSIAKSRAKYQVDGDEVTVTMTRRYAASRPELGVQG